MTKTKEQLKKEIQKAEKNQDIASLYVLEQHAHDVFDADALHQFYITILDIALEKLTDTLESHRVMDINEVQDFATLRALYEYAIEHYSEESFSDAAALFEVLSGLSDDKEFSTALLIHKVASQEQIPFDIFLDTIADINKTQQAGTFYISQFHITAQKLLEQLKNNREN
ncbi:MAG: hypothetical protein RBR59_00725 [Sulfurimonadaceae bacterium]|jgi:antitoxin component of RelBE/YafQ-DinJ toxin-antitoxin module|nr:hypothetical protein [Sulfurimonadaceae bacterium]